MKVSTGMLGLLALGCTSIHPASAASLNPGGLGQVLIYPYYTVNKGQDTLLSVVNSTDVGKLVKVRFREGYNNREVLDFNLFLSAHDVWTAVVTQPDHADTGGAVLKNDDKSCTYPRFPDSRQVPFRKNAYAGGGPAPFNEPDGGPQTIERTREGYFEILAIGDIRPGSATSQRITHIQQSPPAPNAGTPPGCNELSNGNVAEDLDAPTNGLFGSAAIINGQEGTFFGYNADAISGFTDIALVASDPYSPTLRQANSSEATAGSARAYLFAGNRQIALDYEKGEDAVSAVFMADALYNEYLTAANLGASTDWIVTFPTKNYYVDRATSTTVPYPPFEHEFTAPGRSEIKLDADFFDREEGYSDTYNSGDCGFLCQDDPFYRISYAVNVIRILPEDARAAPSEVFGSMLSSALVATVSAPETPPGDSGWIRLNLARSQSGRELLGGVSAATGTEQILRGLPATGFMAYNVVNDHAQNGKLANYSGTFAHRSTVSCAAAANAEPGSCDGTPEPIAPRQVAR